MKKVEAIIRQDKLNEVMEELNRHQFYGLTATPVMGCGLQKGVTRHYRGSEFTFNLHPKMKIEIVVKDTWVNEIIECIINITRTGEIGDGKIFIYNIEDAIRIRTGQRGEEALI